jgi:hypothetical protein
MKIRSKPLHSILALSILVLSTLALSGAANAQTTVKGALSTSGNYGNYAKQGRVTSFKTVAANTLIVPGKQLSIHAGTASGGVDTIVGWNLRKGGIITCDVSEQGAVAVGPTQRTFVGGSTASTHASRIVPGPHSLLLSILGRAGTTGLMEFWAGGVVARGVAVKYVFDVGNDGRVDFAWSPSDHRSKLMKVVIPRTNRLVVKITSSVVVAQGTGGSLRYKTGASVRFTPGPHCAARVYGDSCGPRLAGVFSRPSVTVTKFALHYTNATPNARGLLVFGTKFVRIPIPGSKCVLLTDPRIVVPFKSNSLGRMSWLFSFKTGTQADVKIQAADLGGRRIRLSNGLQTLCIK